MISDRSLVQDDSEKMNILVVDDRPENLLALRSVLEDLGQNIVVARSGPDALKHVLSDQYAVILLDVQMPTMNGFETAALIRSRERSQDTPILFLTATNRSDASALAGYSVGAVDYIVKPLDPDILKAKVAVFVELSRKTRELEAEVQRRKRAEEEIRILNAELESRVMRRSAELRAANSKLTTANRALTKEIQVRKRAEADLLATQEDISALNVRLRYAVTETHHRVKNNLQVITALVDMLRMNHTDAAYDTELQQVGQHIRALAALHDVLTSSSKFGSLDHDRIAVRDVLERLIPMLKMASGNREIKMDADDIYLSLKQCASFTLLVNELVTNATKHGAGVIRLRLKDAKKPGDRGDAGLALLECCDAGPGFPKDFDPLVSSSTGFELMRMLSEWDLEGEVEFGNLPKGGARVTVKFRPAPEDADPGAETGEAA